MKGGGDGQFCVWKDHLVNSVAGEVEMARSLQQYPGRKGKAQGPELKAVGKEDAGRSKEEQELEYTRLKDWLTTEQVKVTPDFPSGRAYGYTDSSLQKRVPHVFRTNAWHCTWNAHKYMN